MFGSDSTSSPPKPRGGKHGTPPNPEDRYVPQNVIRLDMVDVDGQPVCVILTPRAAKHLADQLFARLCLEPAKGGAL